MIIGTDTGCSRSIPKRFWSFLLNALNYSWLFTIFLIGIGPVEKKLERNQILRFCHRSALESGSQKILVFVKFFKHLLLRISLRSDTQSCRRAGFLPNNTKCRPTTFIEIWNCVFGLTWPHTGSQNDSELYASANFMTHGHEFHDFRSEKHQHSELANTLFVVQMSHR